MEGNGPEEYADLREAAEVADAYPGRGRSVEEAIENAWRRVPQDKKPAGLRVAEIRVVGGNPINWYGVILRTS